MYVYIEFTWGEEWPVLSARCWIRTIRPGRCRGRRLPAPGQINCRCGPLPSADLPSSNWSNHYSNGINRWMGSGGSNPSPHHQSSNGFNHSSRNPKLILRQGFPPVQSWWDRNINYRCCHRRCSSNERGKDPCWWVSETPWEPGSQSKGGNGSADWNQRRIKWETTHVGHVQLTRIGRLPGVESVSQFPARPINKSFSSQTTTTTAAATAAATTEQKLRQLVTDGAVGIPGDLNAIFGTQVLNADLLPQNLKRPNQHHFISMLQTLGHRNLSLPPLEILFWGLIAAAADRWRTLAVDSSAECMSLKTGSPKRSTMFCSTSCPFAKSSYSLIQSKNKIHSINSWSHCNSLDFNWSIEAPHMDLFI